LLQQQKYKNHFLFTLTLTYFCIYIIQKYFFSIEYRLIRKLGEGTFSEVLKAQSLRNGQSVAIKCMKSHFDNLEQVNNLREIKAL